MFEGWIIKFGQEELPVKYMAPSSYKIKPEEKGIADDWEDNTGKKHYDIDSHKRATITFNTKMGLHQKDIEEIQRIIKNGLISEQKSHYKVTAWNPYTSSYKEIDGKLDDIQYTMRKVDTAHKDIIYESITIKIEEY